MVIIDFNCIFQVDISDKIQAKHEFEMQSYSFCDVDACNIFSRSVIGHISTESS